MVDAMRIEHLRRLVALVVLGAGFSSAGCILGPEAFQGSDLVGVRFGETIAVEYEKGSKDSRGNEYESYFVVLGVAPDFVNQRRLADDKHLDILQVAVGTRTYFSGARTHGAAAEKLDGGFLSLTAHVLSMWYEVDGYSQHWGAAVGVSGALGYRWHVGEIWTPYIEGGIGLWNSPVLRSGPSTFEINPVLFQLVVGIQKLW